MSDRRGAAACADKLNSTSPIPVSRRVAWLALAVSSVAALVVACGGGGGGGVGTNGTGSVNFGTVTGFGSVIVDGVRYDDSKALVQVEDSSIGNSPYALAEVKLGHRTIINTEAGKGADDTVTGVASQIELDPALTGYVERAVIAQTDPYIYLLGQTVLINGGGSGNSNSNVPVTVLDGYTTIADIQPGDPVEVHAIRQVNPSGVVVYYATRIEKQSVAPTFVRVAGLVSSYNTSSFQLGDLTVTVGDAALLPDGSKLAKDASVVVYAAAVPPTFPGDPVAAVTAFKVRVRTSFRSSDTSYVSGLVSSVGATTFSIDGITVNFATLGTALAEGSYVRVRGTRNSDGSYTASRIQQRKSNDNVNGSELHGTVIRPTATSFTVRDTLVLFDGQTSLQSCKNDSIITVLATLPFVEVDGLVTPQGVLAKTIKCDDTTGSGSSATITRLGTPSQLNTDKRSFILTTPAGDVTVNYAVNNLFRGITEANLLTFGSLEVEGMLSGTVLTATKVKPDSTH